MTIKDAAGKEVKVGDKVAYVCTRSKSLLISNVVSLTPTGVNVYVQKTFRYNPELKKYEYETRDAKLFRAPDYFVVIE